MNRLGEYWSATAVVARPGVLPAGYGIGWLDSFTEGAVLVLMAVIVLLFPNGRPPTPRWWWAGAVVIGGGAVAAARPGRQARRPGGRGVRRRQPDRSSTARRRARRHPRGGPRSRCSPRRVAACAASLVPRWLAADTDGAAPAEVAGLVVVLWSCSCRSSPSCPTRSRCSTPSHWPPSRSPSASPSCGCSSTHRRDPAPRHHRGPRRHRLRALCHRRAGARHRGRPAGRAARSWSLLAGAVTLVAFPVALPWTTRIADRLVLGPRARPYEVLAEFTAEVGERIAATS